MELPQRFWDKVNKTSTCWLWTGAAQEGGRKGSGKLQGRFRMDGKAVLVHKISFETHLGRPLAPGMVTRHKCVNSLCVNPDHLEEGTQADNVRDKIRDGTSIRGDKHHFTKLTETQVREIRASDASPSDIGRQYGIDPTNVSHIKAGRSWAWLK